MKKITIHLLLLSAFSFAQVPQINSFSPYSAAVAEEVVISGSGFDPVASNNIVYFGGVKASVSSATSNQLSVLVPAHATDSPISVTSNGGTDESTLAFKVTDSEISSFEVSASIFDSSVSIPSISNAYTWYEDDVFIAVADFNLDGKPDVAKLGKSTSNVRVHQNTSTLSIINASSFDSGIDFSLKNVTQWSIAAKDMNSDGLIDIITHGQDFVSILINNSTQGGAISFETFVEVPVNQYKYNLEVADFDGDGLNDFVIQSNYTQPVDSSTWRSVVYLNTSTSVGLSFTTGLEILTNGGSRELASGDINGDGLTDLISSNSGKIHINTSTLGSISFSSFNFSIGSDITSIFDIDNDGDNDLISAQGRIFINNISDPLNVSPSDFSQLDLSENTGASKGDKMTFGDINSDGKMDFLVNTASTFGTPFQLFINNSDGVLASTSFSKFAFNNFGKSDVIIIDVDGDNAKDVILCNMDQSSFLVIQNMLPYQPIINSTASFNDFETCNQTSSDSQSFIISGESLTEDINISTPSGYEVSTDNSTFSSSLTLSQSSGTVAETTIYVRLTGATTGDFNSNISVTSQDATSVDIALTGIVYESPVISGNSSIEYNTTATFTATTTPSAPAPWSSSNTSVGTITDSGEFSALTLGTTTISFENSNGCIDTLEINVVDTTAPVITLTGDATVTLQVGATYNEQGATATDNYDTTVNVVISGDTVDTNTVGTYTVTYNATDAAGNNATEVTRTVNVVDTTAPVITLTGDATVTLQVGATYNEQGATATDNYDTTVNVVISGDTVDTNTVGTYTVTYNATDAAGNNATEVTRTVNVVDTTAPVITLTGDATVTLEVGATYNEQGATATDNYDTTVNVVISGDTVDTNTVGTYTVTYNATDAAGNNATEVTRTVNVVDTTAPVITLTGDATVTLQVGATYNEQGATATDNYDTTVNVVISGDTVDTNTVGTYTVTYNATDAAGNNATEVTRTVNVVDTTAPVITLTGDATVTLQVGATYNEQGATATDNYDTTVNVVISGDTVDTNTVGTYTVTYNATDAAGNNATEVTRTVNVVDTTAPVITLTGDATVTLQVGATYNEQGATATDNYDTTVNVVISGDTVDTNTVGTYTVTYNATDAAGNNATEVTRTVNVVDTTAPVITLTGDATVTLEVGATYNEQGATATDNYDTTVNVVISGDTVDTNTVGTYTVTYNATDAAGNNATEVTRTVNVVDTTAPVITLTGDATVTLQVGATYNEQGATATDNYDTTVNVVISGDTVDTNTVGTYTVTYNATDAAGNNATEVTRTVNVVDTTAPVITLTGDATVTLQVGATYNEQGATATDNYDTTVNVVISGDTVDTNTVGTYTVTYNATDAAGNNATEVTRTVNVVDTTAPVITLTGDATVTLQVGATYNEQGATATDNYDTTVNVVISGDTVDTNTVGTYTVTYNATDAAGNNATEVTRTVNVVDTTAPVITLTGDATVTLEVGATYNEQGATATDNYDTTVNVVISGDTVDTNTVGTYTVTYNATDAAGNNATEVTRTVNVVDTTAPVITLTGATVTLEVGATYNEQGATATDNYDTSVTVTIGGDTVDTNTVGTYTVTYNATDAAGNNATEVTRTVNVVDTLSVNEVDEVKLSIFPNPTSNYWIIKAKNEIKSISLYDFSGRKILQKRPLTKSVEINAQSLPSGVYLLSVNKTNTFRLIKL